jgi:hypothetical protein
MSDTMRQGVRFASSSARNNQQRAGSELDGFLLFTV